MDIFSLIFLIVSLIILLVSIFLICWLVETLNSINKNLSLLRIDANVIRTLLKEHLCEEENETKK